MKKRNLFLLFVFLSNTQVYADKFVNVSTITYNQCKTLMTADITQIKTNNEEYNNRYVIGPSDDAKVKKWYRQDFDEELNSGATSSNITKFVDKYAGDVWCSEAIKDEAIDDSNASSVVYSGNIPEVVAASINSRSVSVDKLCKTRLGYFDGTSEKDVDDCSYINAAYALCDTHAYNAGSYANSTNSEDIETMNQIIAAKITVISQQMYKQYEYLSSTLRRLRTQLQKAVLMADLEMAGGNSEKSSSGSYSRNNDKEIVLAGAQNCNNISRPAEVYRCLQENINLVRSNVQTNRNQAKKQLDKIVDSARNWGLCLESEANGVCKEKCASYSSESEIKDCATSLSIQISRKQSEEEKDIMKYTGRQVY